MLIISVDRYCNKLSEEVDVLEKGLYMKKKGNHLKNIF